MDRRKRPNKFTDEQLLQFLRDLAEELGRTPTMKDLQENPTYPVGSTYHKRFGSYNNALDEAGLEKNTHFYEKSDLLMTFKNDRNGKLMKMTIQSYLSTLTDLYDFLKSKDKGWKDLTSEDIVEYFTYLKEHGRFSSNTKKLTRPNSPKSLRSKVRAISAFLTWLKKFSKRKRIPLLIDEAEIEEIRDTFTSKELIPPDPGSARRGLMEEEVQQIRNAIDSPIERNIFDLGLNLGLRASEYGKITIEMVLGKPEEQMPKLNGNESIPRYEHEHYIEVLGKGNKLRRIVVTDEMKVMIRKQLLLRKLHRVEHDGFFFNIGELEIGRLNSWNVQRIYKRIRENGGVNFTSHVLRYTMASQFLRRDVKEHMIKQRLGHAGGVTHIYEREKILARYRVMQEKVGAI